MEIETVQQQQSLQIAEKWKVTTTLYAGRVACRS